MAVATSENKALVASSEFDPSAFIKGIDAMTASLEKLSVEEDKLRADLKVINTSLKENRAEYKITTDQIKALDTASKTYTEDLAKLTTQQTNLKNQQKELRATLVTQKDALTVINKSANDYKASLAGLAAISKQVTTENKGRTLFDVASLNQQVQQITQLGGKLRNAFQGKISTADLDKFEASLAETKDEFQQLEKVITFVKSKLDTLDPDSQDFKDLNQIIETGGGILEQYGNIVENNVKGTISLRSQLKLLKEELTRLEDQGQDNTEQFEQLAIEAGKLQDQLGDTQQRIRVLSSDTKNLDFGIGTIRGVASAFGLAEGTMALFGLKSEDVAASLQRLNAIMLILNGLQEIQTLLQKQSVVAIVGQSIATKAAAAAQAIFAVTTGTSTGALRAFRIALLATGIGAFLVLIGFVADAMGAFGTKTEDAVTTTDQLTASIQAQDKALSDLNDTLDFNTKLRIENIKQQGGSPEDIFKAELEAKKTQLKNLENEVIESQKRSDQFDDERRIRAQETQGDISKKEREAANESRRVLAEDIEKRKKAVQDKERDIQIFEAEGFTKRLEIQRTNQDKSAQLYQQYLERLLALQRQLRDKTLAAQVQDEAAIREQFANQLDDALTDINRDKRLTKSQAKTLGDIVKNITKIDLDQALKEFKETSLQAEQDLANTIFDLRLENGKQRAELLRDQFLRETEVVRNEAETQAAKLIKERDEAIKNVQKTPFILPSVKKENIERIKLIYEQLLENLATQTTRKQEEISARVFEAAQEQVEKIFQGATLITSKVTTDEILKLSARYQQGKITFEKFQKELTRITTEESTKRIAQNIREQEELLKNLQKQALAEKDPERQKGLQQRIIALQLQIEDLKRQLAIADAAGTNADQADRDKRLAELSQYAQAIGGIINQVVSFWAQVNEAEQRSLEKSIRLQEARVEAATRIAERGNSEYLRLEEDRLNELQTKQENAARRQLAINAVLQTSQALTAFVSALAQGIALGGPLGGIAIAGAVIAAISAGYAIIQSLQPETQGFREGTKSVKRKGEPAGVDTVPARLTEGEAVLPVDVNREYKPTVEAIFDKKIPAEVINNFVNNYNPREISTLVNNYRTNQRVIPKLDHDRMIEAAEVRVVYDGQLLQATKEQTKKIEENSDLLARVEHRLKTMGVEVNLDRNGLAVSLMKAVDQFKIDKKS